MEGNQKPPRSGPRGIGQLAAIAVGAYTDIVAIYGPAEAVYGEPVTIEVVVKNLATFPIYVAATGRYNGVDVAFAPDYAYVDAGGTYSFTASFSMPNKTITLDVWSFYWTGTEWYQDDHEAVTISLKTLKPTFRGFGLTEYIKV